MGDSSALTVGDAVVLFISAPSWKSGSDLTDGSSVGLTGLEGGRPRVGRDASSASGPR